MTERPCPLCGGLTRHTETCPLPNGDEMARAHREDYDQKRAIDAFTRSIHDFLATMNFDSRLSPKARQALCDAVVDLERTSKHIVAVWD